MLANHSFYWFSNCVINFQFDTTPQTNLCTTQTQELRYYQYQFIEPQFSINILKIEVRENIISGLVGLTVVRTLVAVRIKKNEQERFCFIIFSIVFILITSKY